MESCILYQNEGKAITVVDIPKSIELAQGQSLIASRRLISCQPLENPYPSVEPRSAKALSKFEDPSISELVLQRYLELALEQVREAYQGPWSLPRLTGESSPSSGGKRKRQDGCQEDYEQEKNRRIFHVTYSQTHSTEEGAAVPSVFSSLYENDDQSSRCITWKQGTSRIFIPPKATFLGGSLRIRCKFSRKMHHSSI